MLLLQDRCGADFEASMTSDESLKNLEHFVNQMDVVSTKILKEYNAPVITILKKWKEDKEKSSKDSSSSSSSSSDSEDEERKKNDFRIDR